MIEPEIPKLLVYFVQNTNRHLPKSSIREKNWNMFIKYAKLNRCVPFLWHLIKCPDCQKLIPKRTINVFNNIYFGAYSQWKYQENEKKKIYKKLRQKKVISVPFKDHAFGGLKYRSPIFPQKGDVDIFVPVENSLLIDRVMFSEGYKLIDFPFPKDKFALLEKNYIKKIKGVSLLFNFHFKEILTGTEGKVNPLNKNVVESFTTNFTDSIKKNQKGAFTPSIELSFISFCLHFFFRDRFAGLRSLYEISQYLSQFNNKLKWEKALETTGQLGLESYFLFVLKIANLVFNSSLPQEVSRRIERKKNVQIALKFYFPSLSAMTESPEEWLNHKINKDLWHYRFFIKLILWEKPFYRKLGPRALFLFLFYFLPTYFRLRKNY
ncbi:MAG: nucleotidyltransferase family protein [bacterium]|nr:nucleotidyltransferase family protein [bacterium]